MKASMEMINNSNLLVLWGFFLPSSLRRFFLAHIVHYDRPLSGLQAAVSPFVTQPPPWTP